MGADLYPMELTFFTSYIIFHNGAPDISSLNRDRGAVTGRPVHPPKIYTIKFVFIFIFVFYTLHSLSHPFFSSSLSLSLSLSLFSISLSHSLTLTSHLYNIFSFLHARPLP